MGKAPLNFHLTLPVEEIPHLDIRPFQLVDSGPGLLELMQQVNLQAVVFIF